MKLTLDQSIERVNSLYQEAKERGLTANPSNTAKTRLDDDSYTTYCTVMIDYLKYLNDAHGITDLRDAKPWMAYEKVDKDIEKIQIGEGSAFTLHKFVSAMNSFFHFAKQCNTFGRSMKIGDSGKMRETMADEGIERKAGDSRTLKATDADCAAVQFQIAGSRSPHAETFVNVSRVQQMTGGRVSATFGLTAGDIRFVGASAYVTFDKDKGGLTRTVTVSERSEVDFLERLVDGKKEGAPVFQIQNSQWQDKSIDAAAKQYKEVVKNAAERAGLREDDKKFSSHSFRKNFAQNRYDEYRSWSESRLVFAVKQLRKDPDLDAKFLKTEKSINDKRTDKDGNLKPARELTEEELARWLTSVDLGHGRLDVMRYYITRK